MTTRYHDVAHANARSKSKFSLSIQATVMVIG